MEKIKYIRDDRRGMRYTLLEEYKFYSNTFNRTITIPEGRMSDGATGARDLGAEEPGWRGTWNRLVSRVLNTNTKVRTAAWFVHDELCLQGKWDDGTPVTNFTCSTVLSTILFADGYYLESVVWWWATFLVGGGKARENGLLFTRGK